ncbi:MAG: DUF4114 domain-containing protein, partial [Synechococcaceae cyanobacterium RL_1_2]|nr:DUF4114 domain-containing protein [Synechococcaceae cyanobacterium RL_1_2]
TPNPGGAADESGQTITFVVTTDNDGLFSVLPTIDSAGNLSYTTAANANGTATLTITGTDDGTTDGSPDFQQSVETITLSVTEVNEAPSFVLGSIPTVAEDAGAQTVAGFANTFDLGGPDESNQVLSFVVTTDNDGLFAVLPAIDSNGNLTYTAAPDANGTATLTIVATDDGTTNGAADPQSSSPQTAALTITEVNDAPTFGTLGNQTVAEDAGAQTVSGFITTPNPGGAADESGQTITFVVTTDNDGLFSVLPTIDSNGTLTYTTVDDGNGTATLTITGTDDGTTNGSADPKSLTQTITLTVTEVNDAPSFIVGGNQAINEDAGAQTVANFVSINPGSSNESSQTLTFTLTTDNDTLFAVTPAIDASGTLTYTIRDDGFGVANLTINAIDNAITNGSPDPKAAPSQVVSITVNPINDVPVIISDNTFTVAENVTTVGSIEADDPEDEAVTFVLAGINADLFSVSSQGIISFSQAPDFETPRGGSNQDSNTYTFEVTARDASQGVSSAQTITVQVTNVNDIAPTGPSTAALTQPQTTIDLFSGSNPVVDLEGDDVTIVAVGSAQSGTVTINSNQKTLNYVPNDPTFVGQDTFAYTLSDGVNESIIDLTLNYVGQIISQPTTIGVPPAQVIPIADANPSLLAVIQNDRSAPGFGASAVNGLVDGIAYQRLANTDRNAVIAALANALSQTDASFNNLIGLYRLDNLTGAVRDSNGNVINPGDDGYTEVALSNAVPTFAFRVGGSSSNTLPAGTAFYAPLDGQYYAPFVIANGGNYSGTVNQAYSFFFGLLGANPGNQAATASNYNTLPVAYFSFGAANPDRAAHIKSFGGNVFGFEDLPAGVGISDYDFNDAVFSFG